MAVTPEDHHGPSVLRHPNDNGIHGTEANSQAAAPVVKTAPLGTLQPEGGDQSKEFLLQQQPTAGNLPSRPAARNWARVRQKVIGADSLPAIESEPMMAGNTIPLSVIQKQQPSLASLQGQPNTTNELPKMYPVMEGSGPVSTGLRGVLGFKTVVVQRTQLRKMEKEIEKALARRQNDQYQPRMRTAARIGTGTRGMIPGASYNIMSTPDPVAVDRSFLDELSDILMRWRNLTVEVPCKGELLQTFTKMLLADRPEPLSRKCI